MLGEKEEYGKTRTFGEKFLQKTGKKSLTTVCSSGILVKLARAKARERVPERGSGGAKRTLKTIQRKKTRKKEEDSEDSKEFSTERC